MANDFIGDQVPVTQNCPTCEQLENEMQQLAALLDEVLLDLETATEKEFLTTDYRKAKEKNKEYRERLRVIRDGG